MTDQLALAVNGLDKSDLSASGNGGNAPLLVSSVERLSQTSVQVKVIIQVQVSEDGNSQSKSAVAENVSTTAASSSLPPGYELNDSSKVHARFRPIYDKTSAKHEDWTSATIISLVLKCYKDLVANYFVSIELNPIDQSCSVYELHLTLENRSQLWFSPVRFRIPEINHNELPAGAAAVASTVTPTVPTSNHLKTNGDGARRRHPKAEPSLSSTRSARQLNGGFDDEKLDEPTPFSQSQPNPTTSTMLESRPKSTGLLLSGLPPRGLQKAGRTGVPPLAPPRQTSMRLEGPALASALASAGPVSSSAPESPEFSRKRGTATGNTEQAVQSTPTGPHMPPPSTPASGPTSSEPPATYKNKRSQYKHEKKRMARDIRQTLLDPNVVMLQGPLKVRNLFKNWVRYHCELKPAALILFKNSRKTTWIGTVLLNSCTVMERPSKKCGFCFKLFSNMTDTIWATKGPKGEKIAGTLNAYALPPSHVIFRAPSNHDGKTWMDALELALRCNNSLLASLQTSLERPRPTNSSAAGASSSSASNTSVVADG